MSTGLKGMNIDEVYALATTCETDSTEITSIRSKLTSQIGSTQWLGADADAFRSAWDGEYSRALDRVAQALLDVKDHMTREAQQQEAASGGR